LRRITIGAAACLLGLAAAFPPIPARAQEVGEIPFFHAPAGSAALGGGIRFGNNPYRAPDSDDQRKRDLVPLYLYEGKYVFARGTAGGIHIVDTDALEFNLYARYRFQQLDPDINAYYEGLEKRRQTLDAGLQFALTQRWGDLKLAWLTDTLGHHEGNEVELSYRYRFEAGAWSLSPFVSWSWRDENLTDYYFGVSEAEARPDRPAFSAGESSWVGFGLNTAWHVTDRVVLFGNVGFYGTDSDVVDSPLVEETGFGAGFIGGTYNFGNARSPDYIEDAERRDEWSWRVNYGYQADGNIVGEIDQGDFSRSNVAEDARIGGVTLSKLMSGGGRVDVYGRFAVFRHFEEKEDNGNFFSYAAYIMAMGKGYSPWSKKEWFRWGFGFGASYADRVPIAEQRKQAARDRNTSHFLNYLEMTVDFPLRRVSKANWLQNCYAGVTIVHRSGIFSTSDILGDVGGGSDWLTAHLECVR
jgi:outer membrane scaffolding protein for murein synthesis (MipA/OmpV family)